MILAMANCILTGYKFPGPVYKEGNLLSVLTPGLIDLLRGESFGLGKEDEAIFGPTLTKICRFPPLERPLVGVVWSPYADLRVPPVSVMDNRGKPYPYYHTLFNEITKRCPERISWNALLPLDELARGWETFAALTDEARVKVVITYPPDRIAKDAAKRRVIDGNALAVSILAEKDWTHLTIPDPEPATPPDKFWSHYSDRNRRELWGKLDDIFKGLTPSPVPSPSIRE